MRWYERKAVLAVLVLAAILGVNGMLDRFEASRGEPMGGTEELAHGQEPLAAEPTTGAEGVLAVHVCGAVAAPGLYELPEGSRVDDAVKAAGGLSASADPVSVNLAEHLTDGQQVLIYEKTETVQSAGGSGAPGSKPASGGLPVSINRGGLQDLMLLEGIGEKTAEKILEYRKAQGGFKKLEELMNVPGIGEKKFEKIKNDIRL